MEPGAGDLHLRELAWAVDSIAGVITARHVVVVALVVVAFAAYWIGRGFILGAIFTWLRRQWRHRDD